MTAVQVLGARDVPLGGPRSMTVRRTLPHRDRTMVGAWCFVDHYGPDDVARTGGMDVPPHPHTGLQTVSWLFAGTVEHRDSGGVHALIRPGELALMTAGRGIAHSEVSTPDTEVLHGVQLWVVLPPADRDAAREVQRHVTEPVPLAAGVRARVFVGRLAGVSSPVRTATPLLGAEVHLDAGTTWTPDVDAGFEHAVLLDSGAVTLDGAALAPGDLGVVDAGPARLTLTATAPSRIVLIGGTPYPDPIVMWWNFIGSDHDEVARARQEWQAGSDRFGEVPGYTPRPGGTARLDAPEIPPVTLRPRHPRGATR